MISTGYFAKTKSYIEAGIIPISVSLKTPSFFKGHRWSELAPPKELFWKWKKENISNEDFMREYESYLENSISEEALQNIKLISSKKEIVLCCYEKSGEFCHRYTLADWLSKKLNLLIGEVTVVQVKKN